MKQWNQGEKVVRNNNTDPGLVVKQEGKWVIVSLDRGGQGRFSANDLKRKR